MPHIDPVVRKEYYRRANAKRSKDPLYKQWQRSYSLRGYGLSTEDYENILAEQNYCCAICNKHHNCFKKRLAVDHDHRTGEIRGLLCTGCNKFIISDRTIEFFEKVLNYMKNAKHKGKSAVGRGR